MGGLGCADLPRIKRLNIEGCLTPPPPKNKIIPRHALPTRGNSAALLSWHVYSQASKPRWLSGTRFSSRSPARLPACLPLAKLRSCPTEGDGSPALPMNGTPRFLQGQLMRTFLLPPTPSSPPADRSGALKMGIARREGRPAFEDSKIASFSTSKLGERTGRTINLYCLVPARPRSQQRAFTVLLMLALPF